MKDVFMATAAPVILCALCMLYVAIFDRPPRAPRTPRA